MSATKQIPNTARVFKTAWFSRAARKALISDDELCKAIQQVMNGQADNLGGGVFKKRLNENMHRCIILAKGKKFWVYVYLFAKKDRANIGNEELAAFRDNADWYAKRTDAEIEWALDNMEIVEICHEGQVKI